MSVCVTSTGTELPPTITTTAAEQYLGNALGKIESTFDDFWHREVRESWEQRYNYVQKTRAKLDAYKLRHEEGKLKVEEEWLTICFVEQEHLL